MSAVLKRKPVSALRTHNPGDFETLFEIDRVCYEPSIAYSREEKTDWSVIKEKIRADLKRSSNKQTRSAR